MTERTRGDSEIRSDGGDASSRIHVGSGPGSPGGPPRARLRDAKETAGEWASRAREQLDDGAHRIRGMMPSPPQFTRTLREKPLSVLGLALSAGFLIAVTTGGSARATWLERVRRHLKTVIVTGVTAAIVQELRDLVSEDDLEELFTAWSERGTLLEDEDEL